MTLTEQQQFEENFKRGFEEGQHISALKIAKRMLTMRNDPEFIKGAIYFYIKEMTELSYQDIHEIEEHNPPLT